jgi:hypothetical protein
MIPDNMRKEIRINQMERRQVWLSVLWLCFGFSMALARNPVIQIPAAKAEKISIAFGQHQSGTLAEGESNSFAFSAAAGDRVIARLSRISGFINFRIELLGPDGKKLAEAVSEDSTDLVSPALPSAGIYTIRVGYASGLGQGGYHLALERLNSGSGISLSFGQTVSGRLGAGDLKTYTFSGAAGNRIIVRMNRTSDSLGPEVRIYGPDGTKLDEAWSAAGTELGGDTLPSTGTYTILVVDHWGTNEGGFNLTLERLSPESGVPISNGQPVSGTLLAGDLDVYGFTTAAGSRLRIRVNQTSKAGIFYPEIRLYSPAGKKLQDEWAGQTLSLLTEALPSAGIYTLLIGDYYGVFAGEYTLVIERL